MCHPAPNPSQLKEQGATATSAEDSEGDRKGLSSEEAMLQPTLEIKEAGRETPYRSLPSPLPSLTPQKAYCFSE